MSTRKKWCKPINFSRARCSVHDISKLMEMCQSYKVEEQGSSGSRTP